MPASCAAWRPQGGSSTIAVPAWELVRRWPGLRGEDKLAWLYLWSKSRQGSQQVDTTAAEVAADQGTTADAGRQRIRNLDREGLIRILRHERLTGVFFVECFEPDAVCRAKPVEWDGQRVFGFLMEQWQGSESATGDELLSEAGQSDAIAGRVFGSAHRQEATEDPPELPRCHRGSSGGSSVRAYLQEPSSAKSISGPSTFGALADVGFKNRRSQELSEKCGHRGSSGGSSVGPSDNAGTPAGLRQPFAGGDDETAALARLIEMRRAEVAPRAVEPTAMGHTLQARAVALPQISPESHQQSRDTADVLAVEIRERVGDPRLQASWCQKVAWAVVEGGVERSKLYQLLACCDKVRDPARPTWTKPSDAQPQGVPLSAYFVLGSKRLCRKRGVDLRAKPR